MDSPSRMAVVVSTLPVVTLLPSDDPADTEVTSAIAIYGPTPPFHRSQFSIYVRWVGDACTDAGMNCAMI